MSGPATFPTAIRCITYAMRDAGLLAETDEPKSDQVVEYSNRLNDVINYFGTQGLKLWTWTDMNIPLIQGQTTYTIGPGLNINMTKPLRVLQGYYNDTTNASNPVRRPIYPLSWDEWLRLSTVNTQGAISQYFVDKQATKLNVSFWLTPDSTAATNGSVHLLLEGQIANFTGVTDTMAFPQEWFIALRWNLADEICTGQPAEIMQRCAQKAMTFRTALEDWDVEDASTYFKPDTRFGTTMSKFR